jgi:hypothetical protein
MTDRGIAKATNSFTDVADKAIQMLIEKWPELEAKAIEIAIAGTDALFTPKLMIKHLLVAIAIQTGLVSMTGISMLTEKLFRRFTAKGQRRNFIEESMKNAKTYAEWKNTAEDLDALTGFDKWRLEEDSGLYNVKVLKKRMNDIRAMLNSEDVFIMMFRLRGALSRDQFGMQQQGLFNRARGGTKVIVEEYHQLVINSLNYICDHADPEVRGMRFFVVVVVDVVYKVIYTIFVLCYLLCRYPAMRSLHFSTKRDMPMVALHYCYLVVRLSGATT